MITIFYESHATSVDNVAGRASGHADVPLHETGEVQAVEMGRRYRQTHLDAIFSSDLQRAYRTAEIAFAGREIPLIKDSRLREVDYGDWTRWATDVIQAERSRRVAAPFPSGESYTQSSARVRAFLSDLLRDHDGKTVLIIGHRATHYGLEHGINGILLEEIVAERSPWIHGQVYHLRSEEESHEMGDAKERQGRSYRLPLAGAPLHQRRG
ncbi:MAG: histidine phosphatase family protein [bacterium]